ncbi:MAG: VCBS repeat-containing protein, partial [Bryobacteraceae bacterium]
TSNPTQVQPPNQTLQITSSGSALTYTATAASTGGWLQIAPSPGTTTQTETVSIVSSVLATLPTGSYSGTLTFKCSASTPCANSPIPPVSVTLTVTGTLSASPTSLTFYYTPGGTQPASQAVTFSSNNGAISYTAGTPSANWLQVSPTSGVTQQVETFSINTSNVPTAPNTYSASVVFTCASTSSCTSPTTTVNVTLNVTAQPSLISTSLQTFNSCSGSVTPSTQTLQVTSSGAALNYTASFTPISGGAWLSVSPSSGTTAGIETVTIVNSVAGALTAGTYTGSVVLACNPSNSCSNSPVTVTATLIVSQAAFTVSPLTLNFNGQQDGANPPPQPVTVTSSCPISFTAKAASTEGWLSVSPTSANTPQTLSVSANIGSLAPNKYTDGTITISATGATNPPPVTVNLTVAPILLTATPPSLNFSWAQGTAAPPAQTTTIGTNGAPLSFTTGSCAPWMTVSPLSAGSTPMPLSVSIVTANVALPGALTCNMMVTAAAGNSPFAVPVNLNVTPPGDVTISGQLSGLTGSFGDITVLLTGSQTMSTTTTASGSYSFVVPPGGNYVVNPYQSEYSFIPQHQSFTNLAGNETASFTRVVPSDFNADGWPDIVWQSPTAGSSQVWLMTQGTTLIGTVPLSITAPIVGVGDFNGDGNPDIVTQSSGGTQITFLGPGGTTVLGTASVAGITGRVAAVADFNRDGYPDLVVQDGSGSVTIYYLGGIQGATVISSASVVSSNPWTVVGAGDFNADGNPDLVWQDPVHGSVQIWYMQNNVLVSSLDLTVNNTWLVASVADFNQDGHPDLIWQDPVTGIAQVWFLTGAEGTTLLSTADISKSNTWRIVGPR